LQRVAALLRRPPRAQVVPVQEAAPHLEAAPLAEQALDRRRLARQVR